jgi:hypothetical protein
MFPSALLSEQTLMGWMLPPDGIKVPMYVVSATKRGESTMNEVTLIGVDLAKSVFQAHGAAADGSTIFRKKLTRIQFAQFMAEQPPCVVAMEACGYPGGAGERLSYEDPSFCAKQEPQISIL